MRGSIFSFHVQFFKDPLLSSVLWAIRKQLLVIYHDARKGYGLYFVWREKQFLANLFIEDHGFQPNPLMADGEVSNAWIMFRELEGLLATDLKISAAGSPSIQPAPLDFISSSCVHSSPLR